jgi:hypothetical protein
MGDPEHVAMRYLQLNFSEKARAAEADDEPKAAEAAPEADPAALRLGDRTAEVVDAWFEGDTAERAELLSGGAPATFVMVVRFHEDVEDPAFNVSVQNNRRDTIFSASTASENPHPGWYRAGELVMVRFVFDNVLSADRYTATPSVSRPGSGQDWLDWRERLVTVVVVNTRPSGGLIDLPTMIDVDRAMQAEVPR